MGSHVTPEVVPISRPRTRANAVVAVETPTAALDLCTLGHIDYSDAFIVTRHDGVHRTGEQWARAVLEGAPPRLRRRLRYGWFGLGLKLGSTRSPERVLGWPLRHSSDEYALLGASSRIGLPAQLLFAPQADGMLFATFVRHRNPAARAVWAVVTRRHRRVVRYLLERA
jgi:hypothetical protein